MRASDIRRGQAVIVDGTLYVVTNADHNTPGNLRAKVQFKLRDVVRGTIIDKRVGATDNIETATLDRRTVEFLYRDGSSYVFMDTESYDQPAVPADVLGDDALYLVPNMQMQAFYHDGRMVSYELPKTVEHAIIDTPPGIKGATATNQLKDATTETGLVVKVPPFLNPGDRIRISTDNRQYLERAK